MSPNIQYLDRRYQNAQKVQAWCVGKHWQIEKHIMDFGEHGLVRLG